MEFFFFFSTYLSSLARSFAREPKVMPYYSHRWTNERRNERTKKRKVLKAAALYDMCYAVGLESYELACSVDRFLIFCELRWMEYYIRLGRGLGFIHLNQFCAGFFIECPTFYVCNSHAAFTFTNKYKWILGLLFAFGICYSL